MAKKLINRTDVLDDLVEVVAPKYFPDDTLDNNRVSIFGYISESMANSIEDTVVLEQRRSEDYCPELSTSQIRVRQTAKLRGVGADRATPGRAFAMLSILKEDILTKGTHQGNTVTFTVDRRSTILHNGINFSLEDDIIIRAVWRSAGYIYAASYSGEHSSYESYIQMFEQQNDIGQEMVTLVVQIYQCAYNIQEKVVTDAVEFLYDGLYFDYDNLLADFEVYYRQNPTGAYKKADLVQYLSTEPANGALLYNDDEDGILRIINNPALNIGINAMIRVEIKETLGSEGAITIGDDNTTFSLYRDGAYNYSGINISISMLSDTTGVSDGDSIDGIKQRLIDAKTRRDNITTEHDIVSYINDVDANVQLVKKRNDIEDRRYYLYTLLRRGKEIIPATTKRLNLIGPVNVLDKGDFDRFDPTVDRKVLRAYNKFQLHFSDDDDVDNDYVTKVPHDAAEEGAYYLTCPFMMLINDKNVISYYFTSVDDEVLVNMKPSDSMFPFQMIIRSVQIFRDSHDADENDLYRFTVAGTMNTSSDEDLVDDEGNILDPEAIMCYIVFRQGNTPAAYLPMKIATYDKSSREFTFTGIIKTTDYITENDGLEIVSGLFRTGVSEINYNSTIDFKDAFFDVSFMYKYDDAAGDYGRSDQTYSLLPSVRTDGYVHMCSYANNANNTYDLILEFNKFTSSPVSLGTRTEAANERYAKLAKDILDMEEAYEVMVARGITTGRTSLHNNITNLKTQLEELRRETSARIMYSIGEVPFIEYEYGLEHIASLYPTFENMADVYGSLLKLTTDFEISLKFIATYGHSKYIQVTGGRDPQGAEVVTELRDLNPTLFFKVYGVGVDLEEIRNFIYEYLRDTYITGATVFMSNICTLVEQNYSAVRSIKYMGVNSLDASYQEFTYVVPDFKNIEMITKFVPEQLNVTDIHVELDENL